MQFLRIIAVRYCCTYCGRHWYYCLCSTASNLSLLLLLLLIIIIIIIVVINFGLSARWTLTLLWLSDSIWSYIVQNSAALCSLALHQLIDDVVCTFSASWPSYTLSFPSVILKTNTCVVHLSPILHVRTLAISSVDLLLPAVRLCVTFWLHFCHFESPYDTDLFIFL